jgi:predicted GNAT family acetyltransferase
MDIKQANNDKNGSFFIALDGREIASMHYVWAVDDKLIIDHTEVAEAFEGRGLGKQLLSALVSYCRSNGVKVIPLCPFAKALFDKVEEYRVVLA